MKNIFILASCICNLFLISCATPRIVKSFGEVSQVPLEKKDFIAMGVIYVQSSATLDVNGMVINGSKVTFEMLLKEAEKIGADDIVNLRVDEIVTPPSYGSIGYASRVTYKATALAIKYLAKNE